MPQRHSRPKRRRCSQVPEHSPPGQGSTRPAIHGQGRPLPTSSARSTTTCRVGSRRQVDEPWRQCHDHHGRAVIRSLGAGAHPRQGRARVSRVVRWRIFSIPDSAGASACDGNIAQAVSDVVPGMANVGVPRECSRRVVGPGLWLPWAPLMRAVIRVGISLGRSCSKPEGGKCASAGKQGRRDDPLGSRCGLHLVILHSLPTPRTMALATPCTSRLHLHMGNFPHVCVI
jgi:hypothetical protein